MRRSPVQRVLSRGVYEEQYERSLRDCMEGAEGFEEMLAAHEALVSITLYVCVQVQRDSSCVD